MKHTIAIFIALLFLVACNGTRKQKAVGSVTNPIENFDQWLVETVEQSMKENNIPALSIGVVREGKLVGEHNFGEMKRGSKQPVTEQSLYQIGSQSKMLTGIIAQALVAEGKLNLDAPITSYLETVLSEEGIANLEGVNLKNVLQHTAGFPRSASEISRKRIDGDPWTKGYSEASLIQDINQLVLESAPDTKWEYSNFAYGVIGYVCEQVSGKSYAQLLEQYIARPYTLANTVVKTKETQGRLVVTPYRKDKRMVETQEYVMGKLTPASAVYSNVTDLSNLLIAQLKAYQMAEETANTNPLVLTNHTADTGMEEGISYGFGLFKSTDQYGTSYGHGGDMDGFACGYRFSPDANIGLVLLSSSGGKWFGQLEQEIFSTLRSLDGNLPVQVSKPSMARSLLKVIEKEGFEAGLKWFETAKDSEDYQALKKEEMNSLGYQLLEKGKVKNAIEIFKLNVAAFPEYANAYDSLGEAYLKDGKKELAIKNYQKSVDLDPSNKNGVKVLKGLQ